MPRDIVLLIPNSSTAAPAVATTTGASSSSKAPRWQWIAPVPCVPVIVSASDVDQATDLHSTHCAVMLSWLKDTSSARPRPRPFALASAGGPVLLSLPHLALVALYGAVTAADWIGDVGFVRTVVARLALRGLLATPAAACFALARVESSCAVSVDRDHVRRVIDSLTSWLARTAAPVVPPISSATTSTASGGAKSNNGAAPTASTVDAPPRVVVSLAPWREVPLCSALHAVRDVPSGAVLKHASTIDLTNGGETKVALKDAIKALLCRPLRAVALLVAVPPGVVENNSAGLGPWWAGVTGQTPVAAWVLDAQRSSSVVELAASQARARRAATGNHHPASTHSPLHSPADVGPSLAFQHIRFALIVPQHTVAILSSVDASEIGFAPVRFNDAPQRFQPPQALLQSATTTHSSGNSELGMVETSSWSCDENVASVRGARRPRAALRDDSAVGSLRYGDCAVFEFGDEIEVRRFFSIGIPDDRRAPLSRRADEASIVALRSIACSDDGRKAPGDRRSRTESARGPRSVPIRPLAVYGGFVPAPTAAASEDATLPASALPRVQPRP